MQSPITLDETQTQVLSDIMTALFTDKRKQFVLAGPAGTGKTVILSELYVRFRFMGYSVVCLAPTGKAASVLSSKGVPAGTIHSFLYVPKLDPITRALIGFTKKDKDLMDLPNFILVDEGSMVSKNIYRDLTSLNIPIVFFGDHEQILPIENEDVGWNVMNMKNLELSKIHRCAAENPIIRLATDVRLNGKIDKKQYAGLPEISFFDKRDITRKNITEINPDVILCGTNKTRITFNELSRAANKRYEEFPESGDMIICLKNHIHLQTGQQIFNGERFKVVDILERNINVTDKNNKKYIAGKYKISPDMLAQEDHPSELSATLLDDYFFELDGINQDKLFSEGLNTSELSPPFTYGYALTVHKSQGSEFSHVMYFDENVGHFCDQKRFRYTAITRASQQLTLAL